MTFSNRGFRRGLVRALCSTAAVLALLGAGVSAGTATSPAGSAEASGSAEAPTELAEGRYFGAELEWSTADAGSYSEDVGISPSFLTRPFAYPLDDTLKEDLRSTAQQVAEMGALAVVTLEPSVPLGELTAEDAEQLAEVLQDAGEEYGTAFFIRFAPEMNGTWFEWGQQPEEYVAAFRTVAEVVHAQVPSAAMLWAPSYASGYPFTEAYGALDERGEGTLEALDTNGNELVDFGDDPYAPYYPGDDAVDWVGLTMYHYGSYQPGRVAENDDDRDYSGSIVTSVLPEEDKFATQLEGSYGLPPQAPQVNFAKEYAAERGKRFFIQTAALYDPEDPDTADEVEIKTAWLNQLFDPAIAKEYPEIGMIAWLEDVRTEPEAEDRTVDWRLGGNEEVAEVLRNTLERSAGSPETILAPVVEPYAAEEAAEEDAQAGAEGAGGEPRGLGTTISASVAALAVGGVIAWLLAMVIRPNKPRGN
ncbi:glycosyl hydrolase [Arthrobacter sp. JZ12]|uniref:glycosyl hydrolase n=1 Tax=Arthrobacter sp. JZ12 TaxID=2654190 RepID=UPI002B4A2E85|nr:glycosyl hydrolase [Arthrobacter sp. JZ12]